MVAKTMVKSNICPVCIADIPGEYVEEGDLRISDEAISCPNCGFTLEGVVDECPELEQLDKGEEIGLPYTRSKRYGIGY
jgi:hypothetical protein